jgi:predicted enzyme related to lactoylglutathione lyase
MGNSNSTYNRAVWFDIAVTNLERAATFYRRVLDIDIQRAEHEGFAFCVLDHAGGNGGCLVPTQETVQPGGVLIYLNVDGRIRDAVVQVLRYGGEVLEPVRSMGEHGFRAVVRDSEGNRIALHSNTDA